MCTIAGRRYWGHRREKEAARLCFIHCFATCAKKTCDSPIRFSQSRSERCPPCLCHWGPGGNLVPGWPWALWNSAASVHPWRILQQNTKCQVSNTHWLAAAEHLEQHIRGKWAWWKLIIGLGQPVPRMVISFFLRYSSTSYYIIETNTYRFSPTQVAIGLRAQQKCRFGNDLTHSLQFWVFVVEVLLELR